MESNTTSWTGTITHLNLTAAASLPMESPTSLSLVAGVGIEGDRYATQKGYYSDRPELGRQITLFEIETLEALQRDHDVVLHPHEHRRNITVEGVPLNHLVGRRFKVGNCILEATRLSTPCKHIEDVTGKRISRWLINRSGLNCIIIKGGLIEIGNAVQPE